MPGPFYEKGVKPDYSTSVCAMLMVQNVDDLLPYLTDGVEEPHVTLFYLGDRQNFPEEAVEAMLTASRGAVQVRARVTDIERFTGTMDNGDPIVARLESPNLTAMNKLIKEALQRRGWESESKFKDTYRAHVTLGYLDEDAETPDLTQLVGTELIFDRMHFNTGDGDLYWNLPEGKSIMGKVETKGHDLVFFSNRSTPKVVSSGMECTPKQGWGKQTKRRKATEEEEAKIRKGDWLRVDQSGNKPSSDNYKRTRHRPWLVEKSLARGSSPEAPADFSVGNRVEWNSSGGKARGKIKRKIIKGQPNEADGDARQNASADDPVYVIETDHGDVVQHHGGKLRRLTQKDRRSGIARYETKGSRASLDRSPRHNWVEDSGGLPGYIREIARSIHEKRGIPLDQAIPLAIGVVKRWARGGGDVTAKTRAKAAAAVAKWEALKAKNKLRQATKSELSDTVHEDQNTETKESPMDMEHKSIQSAVEVVDEEKGILETIVSVTGIVDNVNDRILPGAYTKSLARRTPKGVFSHAWDRPVSKPLAIKELQPGDDDLPKTLPDGTPWPKEAGALKVKAQYNLGTQEGRDAYSNAIFYGDQQEWSIGYRVPENTAIKNKGVRDLPEVDLYEYSQVLFGANSAARTVGGHKQAAVKELIEMKALFGDDFDLVLKDAGVEVEVEEVPNEPVEVEELEDDQDFDDDEDTEGQDEDTELKAADVQALVELKDAIGAFLGDPKPMPLINTKDLDDALSDFKADPSVTHAEFVLDEIKSIMAVTDDHDVIESLVDLGDTIVATVETDNGDLLFDEADVEDIESFNDIADDDIDDPDEETDEGDDQEEAGEKTMTADEFKSLQVELAGFLTN